MQIYNNSTYIFQSNNSNMKLFATIISLACIFCAGSIGASDVHQIEELLTENNKHLADTQVLMSHVDATNKRIKEDIEKQQVWIVAIKNVDVLLAKLNEFLDVQSIVVLEALHNITHKAEGYTERLSKDLFGLAQLQLSTKQQIVSLEQKMEAYQKHVLLNARRIDNNILELTKLITRAVLPQLNGLQCSFDSLETSQINVEVELKGLERIKDVSDDTNSKLNTLGEQLRSLNRTQHTGLIALSSAVKQLKPLSSWHIESALRELIISQKRIELDLEACQKHSPPPFSIPDIPVSYDESYEPQTTKVHARNQAGKQVDLVQAWSIKEPSQQSSSSFYASAYANAPQSKPKPANRNYGASPAKPEPGHAVSWQQPLPWESYAAAPAPSPKPKQSGAGRKRPAPNSKPCAQQQSPNPSHYAPAASYEAPPPQSHSRQEYQQKGSKPGQAISWYSVDAQADSY
ncbi:uncharacterized protein LOC133839247 [Drosophila sulfurigaster albostrigata]|uniref:uncharacterized protein LOC133839247 n=1 Tax=Drosophila sulfurigaster albostrigata TaxID=89887 RepID=UPI002D21E439|nr:uncharacterized protein LOC133839247 [Drosophila sulfurigaster albostrigata]